MTTQAQIDEIRRRLMQPFPLSLATQELLDRATLLQADCALLLSALDERKLDREEVVRILCEIDTPGFGCGYPDCGGDGGDKCDDSILWELQADAIIKKLEG